jgi:hypothetical protein
MLQWHLPHAPLPLFVSCWQLSSAHKKIANETVVTILPVIRGDIPVSPANR